MPTLVHEAIVHRFSKKVFELESAAKRVATTDGRITIFLENLLPFGSGTINYRLRGQLVSREPDLRLDLLGGTRTKPTLVVETAYSQNQQQMKEKLKEYIDCTNGEILTALGFDIDHPSAQGIRVTVLRAQLNDHGIYTGVSEKTQVYFSLFPAVIAPAL
jgi:hypothetical protein